MNLKTTPFPEFVASTSSNSINPLFDIVIDENVNLENYCRALIQKVLIYHNLNLVYLLNIKQNLLRMN